MRRRWVVLIALVSPVVVLGVEVQLARSGPRLDDETGFRPVEQIVRRGADPVHVLWLGDSTTTGVGTDEIRFGMAHRVAAGAVEGPVILTVLGESGAQVHEVLDDQVPGLDDHDPDVILVSVGANDVTALTRVPTFRSRYRRMVTTIVDAEPDARLVLLGIPDLGVAPRLLPPLRQLAGWRAAQLDDVIVGVAQAEGVQYVDLAGETSSTFSSDPGRYFSDDDYHPSGPGHGVWAAAVLAVVGRVE